MKKIVQPVVRKIYGGTQQVQTQGQSPQQQNQIQQQNAVRKINSLLQSGTVSVTQQSSSPMQQTKVIQQRQFPARGGLQINQTTTSVAFRKCFVCDEMVQTSTAHSVADTFTAATHTKLSTKIARLVGEGYMVIIGVDDMICRRCYNLFNMMDKAESDVERHKTTINGFLKKKYSIFDDEDEDTNGKLSTGPPPIKMQRLNNSSSVSRVVTNTNQQNSTDSGVQLRKISVNSTASPTINDAESPVKKGPTKLYKCMSCDYKSTDLTTFDSHYQECKGQQANKQSPNTQTLTKKIITTSQVHACNMCQYKTADKANYDEHIRKHYKMRPFKCRICTQRFETREQAQVHAKTHQPDYFKCGMCSATFNRRDFLMKHLQTHDKNKQQVQMVSSVHPVVGNTTQKLLQESIDEALRDTASGEINAKNIQFHSCDTCSVTFLNEALYLQHMKQHKTPQGTVQKSIYSSGRTNNGSYSADDSGKESGQANAASDDLESIFERMHAEKSGDTATPNTESLVITQENTTAGGITFNITIPQTTAGGTEGDHSNQQQQQSIGMDMPTLDGDEGKPVVKQETAGGENMQAPVSMPSLDDEQENTQESQQSNTDAVPMELDEIQNTADGQQIKFILNENGQILSLDNHILTTDMDGNQILVQGTDMEQLQALLQGGGVVMQGEEGLAEGQTLQMLSTGDGQNQMVIIQGADGQEAQLIDASLLDADGNIVIQQHPTGELNAEGTHITTEDGIQIPVSMTFGTTGDGEHITVTEGSEQHLQLLQQQAEAEQQSQEGGETLMLLQQGGEESESAESNLKQEADDGSQPETSEAVIAEQSASGQVTATSSTDTANTSGDGGFLNFDELIQPQIIQKEATSKNN